MLGAARVVAPIFIRVRSPTDEVASPTDLQFYEISDKKIVLTWSGPPGDVSGYRVTAAPLGESSSLRRETTLPLSQNSYIEVSDLEPGTPYRFSIYAVHNGEESLPLIGEQTTSECRNLGTHLCAKRDKMAAASLETLLVSDLTSPLAPAPLSLSAQSLTLPQISTLPTSPRTEL